MKFAFLHNRWFKFSFWGVLYVLWVIWLGNYWWLAGLAVIFDIFITRKIQSLFVKKGSRAPKKRSALVEWIDAIVFAVIAATFIRMFFIEAYTIPTGSMEKSLEIGDYLFVSKLAYGPRIPITPVSVPLVHNVMPFSGNESYSTVIQNKYRRLKGFSKVRRNDIVVFGFPHGDTVLKRIPADDYYRVVRDNNGDRNFVIRQYGPIVVRPLDKLDNYVKRCVAVASDTLAVVNGQVYVNGEKSADFPGVQKICNVYTKGGAINPVKMDELGIDFKNWFFDSSLPGYSAVTMSNEEIEAVSRLDAVTDVQELVFESLGEGPEDIFPFSRNYNWTVDNFGPLWIPAAGSTVKLDLENLPLYRRIIESYEGNRLEVKDSAIFINGEETSTYTFRQDYYFMMGDNRHNSLDSRYWGFVPEDHIVGKPWMIWFSSDPTRTFPSNIRWKRLFSFI